MNLKDFISSGIIENYLLGTATQQEIDLLNDMKQKFPEVNDEINKLENTLIKVAEFGQPALNAQIKEKIFLSIQSTEKTSSNGNGQTKSMANKERLLFYKYSIAAAITLLIASSIMNFLFFNRVNSMKSELVNLNNEKNQMAGQMESLQMSLQGIEEQMAVLTDTSNQTILLKGLGISPNALAKVFWNDHSNEVYLMIHQLPEPPAGKQYQLWAIVDGKPTDAGVFDLGGRTLQKMKNISTPQAFAVTLENQGGSKVPTMEAMYLLGNV